MFVDAVRIASHFTHPVIISRRFWDGSVECACAAFIVVNRDGWILTAAHVIEMLMEYQRHQGEIAKYQADVNAITNDSKLTAKQKRKQIGRLASNPRWVRNISYYWALPNLPATNIQNFTVNQMRDLATGRLQPFDPGSVQAYPIFKRVSGDLPTGRSLCKLGFPFHDVRATYDEASDQFTLASGVLPVPRFPLEGIHTRDATFVDQASGRQAKYIETSSPGLRGQSGGPIFDVEGKVWGLQSRTLHLPLGFSPTIKQGGRDVVEHQFLNVGLGTHVEEIIAFLNETHVSFQLEPSS